MIRVAETMGIVVNRHAKVTHLGGYDHLKLNRPGFPRGFFVQNLRGFFKGVHLCVERLLHFLRRPMTDGAV